MYALTRLNNAFYLIVQRSWVPAVFWREKERKCPLQAHYIWLWLLCSRQTWVRVFVRAMHSRVSLRHMRPFLCLTLYSVRVFTYLSLSSEAVTQALQPRISLLPGHEHLLCVPPKSRLNHPVMYCADENPSDVRVNLTAHCNATMGTVVWLLGSYAMVDRDQFNHEVYGVLIEDSVSYISRLSLFPCGADFLISLFGGSFSITCQNIVNEVNLYRSSNHLFFHEGCEYV